MPPPKKNPPAVAPAKGGPVAPAAEARPIIHPEVRCEIHYFDQALTIEECMAILGWEVEPEGENWSDDFQLLDADGRRVRLTNNANNRWFTLAWAQTLAQDMLRGHWKRNGETCTIGKTGRVLSAQHRLVGAVLAEQERLKNSDHWDEYWTGPIVLETILVFGIEETDDVIQTIDNVRPRTFADVLFSSSTFKLGDSKMSAADRKTLSSALDKAVKLMWERTGAKKDPWAPARTHSESMDFLTRHPKLVEAVTYLFDEDKNGAVSKKLNVGLSAGLMYLMGCSTSDPSEYKPKIDSLASEKALDWALWDKAAEFWVLLAKGAPEFKAVREALHRLVNSDTGLGGTADEKIAVLVKAWKVFSTGGKFSDGKDGDVRLRLTYKPNPDNPDSVGILIEHPTVGGIDGGREGLEAERVDVLEDETGTYEEVTGEEIDESYMPTPEEIEQRAAAVRAAREAPTFRADTTAKVLPTPTPTAKAKPGAKGKASNGSPAAEKIPAKPGGKAAAKPGGKAIVYDPITGRGPNNEQRPTPKNGKASATPKKPAVKAKK